MVNSPSPPTAPRSAVSAPLRRLGAAALALGWALPVAAGVVAPAIHLDPFIPHGLTHPLYMTHAGDGSGRLFIVEKEGYVRIWEDGQVLATPFLDLHELVSGGAEQGLLGLAFHPDYPSNGHFYVDYTDTAGDTVIARYSVSAGDPDVADPASVLPVLSYPQPTPMHNAGCLAFGPDGYLYASSGDGGPGGDPDNRAQSLATTLGKILRIADDGSIPPRNPFVGQPGVREEIWAYGLRNPWRISFDRLTGDLFIGDVGQGTWEEVDFQPAASAGGEDYGWRCYEGDASFNPAGCGPPGDYVFPIATYDHSAGCAVTGGYRYRGPDASLFGTYFFGDYCSGEIWGAVPDGGGGWTVTPLLASGALISSFAEDEDGDLYVVDLAGAIYRLASVVFADGFEAGDLSAWSASAP
jgi:glucose/arabinose dehydrogenase